MNEYEEIVQEIRSNQDQSRAFDSRGHCVTLAGPGSGKTKVLTAKVARLLREEVPPPRAVACLTYNNECVRELERRLQAIDSTDLSRAFI
jgi:superfamily I DNA/RNA helicase